MHGLVKASLSQEPAVSVLRIAQSRGAKLTTKTEVWSWGLTVLKMFTGDLVWKHGTAAPDALEMYLESGAEDKSIPIMPEDMAKLLARCFGLQPDQRPAMQDVAAEIEREFLEA